MAVDTTLPNAKPTYDGTNEQQTRQKITLALQILSSPQAISIYALKTPDVINEGCAWLSIDDNTLVATLNYLDTTNTRRTLVLGTLS